MGSVATFRRLAPEFENESNTTVEAFLSDAAGEMNVDAWVCANLFERGACYLAAHLMSLRKASQALASTAFPPSVVTNLSEDRLSIGFRDQASLVAGMSSLNTTPYGQEYLRLRKKAILTPQLAE